MFKRLKWQLTGETYNKKYIIGRKMYSTGFSNIYAAKDRKEGRDCILKILNESGVRIAKKLQQDPKSMWEGELLKKLNHPNIVKGFDYDNNKIFWIVMEVLDKTVFSYLQQRRDSFDEHRLTDIFYKIAHALNYLHERGLIHRDIAPDNIMFKGDQPKLIDLGMTIPAGSTLIKSRMGTPSYMSPETIKKPAIANSDFYCDIYAFGVVMYELVTGIKLFGGGSKEERMTRVLNINPTPPSKLDIEHKCSVRLENLIMSCLSKDMPKRPKNMGEVLGKLNILRTGKSN